MNFAHREYRQRDITSLFAPNNNTLDEEIILFGDDCTLADLVVHMGVFKSKTQARKNGWGDPIPSGWKEHRIGKRVFFTYNLTPLSRKLLSRYYRRFPRESFHELTKEI